jgi:hypothetical protein
MFVKGKIAKGPATRLRSASVLVLLFLAATIGAQDTGNGSIRGTVVDEKGAPVPGVKVNADTMDGRMRGTLVRYVDTDSSGHFLVDRLAWGKYRLFTIKKDAGYPNTAFSFYAGHVSPATTVTLTPTTPTAEVRIQLGPRAGVVIGSVVSAQDGAPVNASFKLTRIASPNEWFSTSVAPIYRVLLPASTDVLLEVSAPGFKTWTPGHPLRLEAGAEMHLDIQLEPSHDPNLHPSKFLVPEGFAGWLLLEYNVKDVEPVPAEDGVQIFKFPASGALSTSSVGPQEGAEDKYYYYSADGSLHPIPTDYRNGKGMIWGQHEGTRSGVLSQFGFFIGTEEQYKKFQNQFTRPGPIPTP